MRHEQGNSRRLPIVEVQQSTKAGAAPDRADHGVVDARRGAWPDEATAEPLVKSLSMTMGEGSVSFWLAQSDGDSISFHLAVSVT